METLLTPIEAAQRLGIGRTRMFALISRGEVQSVKIGRLRKVPASALDAYIKSLMAAAN